MSLRCWVLYDSAQYAKNKWFADRLVEAGSEYFEAVLIITERLRFGTEDGRIVFKYDGINTMPPDIAISRTIWPQLSVALELAGVRVYNNSEVSRICNDKALTYLYTAQHGIQSIDTKVFDKRFESECGAERYPVIVKSSMGHGGSEVLLVNGDDEYRTAVEQIRGDGFVEQPLCEPAGRDVRVYVMGGKILAAALRSSDSSYKSNYSLGGHATAYELRDSDRELVAKIIGAVPAEMDFVGIDFLLCGDRLLFNEIEDVVGTRMMYEVYNMDAAALFTRYIAAKEGV
ncbi:gamma-F420-2:alpha-L-glutamate ligase [Ruminococcaceae bacterium YRB3002]|nr:gamma-F420-2:alpha-L-glutamate ligase [Ruminococcaceae bacterium YRB3002]